MKNNQDEIIKNIISNDKCLDEILEADDNNQVKEIFKRNGLNLNIEEIENLRKIFKNKLENVGNLNENNLDKVTGGIDKERLSYAACKGLGNGGYFGMWSGAILGATAGMVDNIIKARKGKVDSSWNFVKDVLKTSLKASFVAGVSSAACNTAVSVISEAISEKSNDFQR